MPDITSIRINGSDYAIGNDIDTIRVNGTKYEIGTDVTKVKVNGVIYDLVDVSPGGREIYGVEWDGSSVSKCTRTDDAAGFVDPKPYYSGMSGTPSSPFDDIFPWSGMVKVEDSEAGTLVQIPKFYYKLSKAGSSMKLQISPSAVRGFSVSPAHMDRGDGAGERDYIYIGRYHCANPDYKSKPGVMAQTMITRAIARTNVHKLGSTIWQNDYATRVTLWMLYLVEFADWNSQDKIGGGCSATAAVSRSAFNMGYTDSMPYHTGTVSNSISRTVYGGTQYRWIEGLWDNVFDWYDGIYFSGKNVYAIKNPSDFSDTANGILVTTRGTGILGYISVWNISEVDGFGWFMYPSETVNQDDCAYIGDHCTYNAAGVVLYGGGCYMQNLAQAYGLFYLYGNAPASNYASTCGTRLIKLP